MAESDFAIANELAVLAAGTWPRTTPFVTDSSGVAQPDYSAVPAAFDSAKVTGAPSNGTASGISLPNNTQALLIGIDLRERIDKRSGRITIADFDGTREYTIDISGGCQLRGNRHNLPAGRGRQRRRRHAAVDRRGRARLGADRPVGERRGQRLGRAPRRNFPCVPGLCHAQRTEDQHSVSPQ